MIHHHVVRHIKRVREKPEHVKQRILFVLMVFFGFIILSIWFLTFNPNFSDIGKAKGFLDKVNVYFSDHSHDVINVDSDPEKFFDKMNQSASTTISSANTDAGSQ